MYCACLESSSEGLGYDSMHLPSILKALGYNLNTAKKKKRERKKRRGGEIVKVGKVHRKLPHRSSDHT